MKRVNAWTESKDQSTLVEEVDRVLGLGHEVKIDEEEGDQVMR